MNLFDQEPDQPNRISQYLSPEDGRRTEDMLCSMREWRIHEEMQRRVGVELEQLRRRYEQLCEIRDDTGTPVRIKIHVVRALQKVNRESVGLQADQFELEWTEQLFLDRWIRQNEEDTKMERPDFREP